MNKQFKELTDSIIATDGRLFSLSFIKKDGTVRHMTARLGVKKYLTGKGLSYDAHSKGYLPVFDMQKQEYRMINVNTILETKIDGVAKCWF